MLKADFHLHTSDDIKDNVEHSAKALIDRAAALGFEVLAITNHNIVTYTRELADYAASKGILLIPGIELDVEGSRHVLIINPDLKKLGKGKTVKDLSLLRREETAIIAPHPFYPRKTCLGKRLAENIGLFDAIEYCHFYNHLINFNKKAERLAKEHSLPMVGTSDAHAMWQFNTTYSMVDSGKTINGVIKAIKNGKVEVKTKPIPLASFARRIVWFYYYELKNILQRPAKLKSL